MATYYHGAPEIQPDGLQTLYLMNPGYIGFSTDTSTTSQANMGYMNSTTNSSINQTTLNQHYVGIPLQQPPATSPNMAAVHELMPRVQYNLWNPSPVNNSADLTSQLGLRRPTPTQQGLSLSLSPQQANYGGYRLDPPAMISPAGTSSSASGTSNAVNGLQGVLMGSKYLKATHELLEEVVNVSKGVKDESPKATKGNQDGEETSGGETSGKRGCELSTAERQELQMKKAKLLNMLDEVEQRYRQYHHQMQIVISSFEAVAGAGSAKTYTALALQTISKQFRCLRDTITGQIRATGKSLGEDLCMVGSKSEGGSRLRFVDHQLRQQRALQQLGMMQHNAWRPQRGLPERSVSVLRAWLFEHFLHPYPKDSDKHMLAKQTGLTRNQVSNWFINARVRLWKPMVEEMYLEETKEQEEQNKKDGEKSSKSKDSASKSNPFPSETEQNPSTQVVIQENAPTNTGYDEEGEESTESRLKKARSNETLHHTNLTQQIPNMEMDMKPEEANNSEIFMRFGDAGAGFGGYSIGEFSRFDGQFVPQRFTTSNGVSLTLAPPHCEGLQQPTFLNLSNDAMPMGRRLQQSNDYINMNNNNNNHNQNQNQNQDNNSNNMVVVPHPPNTYDNLSIENRKRFAAPLLPDFFA